MQGTAQSGPHQKQRHSPSISWAEQWSLVNSFDAVQRATSVSPALPAERNADGGEGASSSFVLIAAHQAQQN